MSAYIPIDDKTRLKTYTATARPGKSVVKIELECTDAYSFGYLLERLEDIAQLRNPATKKKAAPLQIEDLRGKSS